MVLFPLDNVAVVEAVRVARVLGCSVWVGSDGMTEAEHKRLTAEGMNVTRFVYKLAAASEDTLRECLDTVREHHPGEIIWVNDRTETDDHKLGS